MGDRLRKPLIALSVSLNVAFLAIWLLHAGSGLFSEEKASSKSGVNAVVSSPLHRDLEITPEQWQQIEFHIQHFREKAGKQRRTIGVLRSQLIDLLSESPVDTKAIRAKQEEILAGQRRMKHLVIDLLLKEKEVLKPEQYRDLLKAIQQYCNLSEKAGSYGSGLGRALSNEESNLQEDNEIQ